METKFINQFELSFELFKEWTRHPVGRRGIKARGRRFALLAIGIALSLFLIVLGIVTQKQSNLIIGLVLLAFYIFLLVINPIITLKKRYELSIKPLNGRPLIRTTTFADKIVIEVGKSKTEYEYSEIIRVAEDESYFYLFINADTVIRIRRDGFIQGSNDEFKGFIDTAIKPI